MSRVISFVNRFWQASAPRIRRADPLLMGAAIAYNTLFALVPLAVAFTATLTLIDRSDTANAVADWIRASFPESVAEFLAEIVEQSVTTIEGSQGLVLVLALAIALWSGSRAVYAVQKALRTMQGTEDQRGYVVTRGLGIAVTIGSSIAVFAIYAVFAIGFRTVLSSVDEASVSLVATSTAISLICGLIAWFWLLLWAIYQWGPPTPVRRAWLSAAVSAVVLTVGTWGAVNLLPSVGSAVAVFGSLGVFLVWLYFVGIVVVATPTVMFGLRAALGDATHQ